ncbi:Alpha/Beta hydrolase protein [Colletotrichum cereale]|nr:Alpha/Beta hydrolase protein [Colletotrichum cereale]
MLLHPLRWDLVLQQICGRVEWDERGTVLLKLVPIASSAEQSLDTALAKAQKGTRRRCILNKREHLESTTIHRVVAETDLMLGNGLYIVTEADLARPDLREAVQGHMVEGRPLCTPSVYADIAMTLGNHLVKKLRFHHRKTPLSEYEKFDHTPEYLVTIADLVVNKALVAGENGAGSQLLQCHVQADWSTLSARCKFAVVSPSSGKTQQHAECTIRINSAFTRTLLSQYSSGESHRINVSSLRARPGTLHISGSMAYRLVSSLADFHRNHRLVQSLVLDPRTHEITAIVSFPADLSGHDDFTAHPAVIDAFTQPAGFCLNLDDATDLGQTVYVNHGWDEMLQFEPIDMKQEYTVYVRMRQVGRTRKWIGDIIVLREDTVAAAFLQYSVNAFPRRVFSSLLSQETRMLDKTPRTAVPWSPLRTPKPGMTFSIDARDAERANRILSPPSCVPLHDLSRMPPPMSASSAPSTTRANGDSSLGSAEARSARASSATWTTGNTAPLGCGKQSSNAGGDVYDSQDRPDAMTDIHIPPCKSVVLQGFPKTANKILFLLPDGSGNAASYASIPTVGRDVCLVGLSCPFLRGDTATMARVPLDRLLEESYLPEIFRRQPPSSRKGYVLGGWSAGGSLAFRAAQLLTERGCCVAGLVLIDAPAPLDGMDRLPKHFYEYCDHMGIFGGFGGDNETPAWLVPHFEGTIGMLNRYCATPLVLPPGEKLRVDVIWAGESVVDRPGAPPLPLHPDDTEGMKFLTVQRKDFGPNKWADLLPSADIMCHKLEGAHHFSLMRKPFISQLVSFIADSLKAI